MTAERHTRATLRESGERQMVRRDVVKLLAAAPLARFAIHLSDVEDAARRAEEALAAVAERAQRFKPAWFTPGEWRLTRALADLVIPKDARSGSATDAGVPEFMDFMMTAYPDMQKGMRDGLAWLDKAARAKWSRPFVGGTPAQQAALLDTIAYPKRANAAVKDGVEFFSRFRDLTASGFWTSKLGVADLQYMGNTALSEWKGCPPAALQKLGVSYGG